MRASWKRGGMGGRERERGRKRKEKGEQKYDIFGAFGNMLPCKVRREREGREGMYEGEGGNRGRERGSEG